MALQAMKDSILNEIVLSAAIAWETCHRDLGDQTFLENPEGGNPVLAYMVSLGPRQNPDRSGAGMT